MAKGSKPKISPQEAIPQIGIVIYSDGSSRKSGEGGYGYVILRDGILVREGSGWEKKTTNNRMEISGVLVSLQFLYDACLKAGRVFPKITIWSDSQYVINSFTNGWLENWKKYGWCNSSGEPVKNQDLWNQMDQIAIAFRQAGTFLEWKWCRGHNGDYWNEHVDKLATAASTYAKTQP